MLPNPSTSRLIIVVGGGGHAVVVCDLIRACGYAVFGVVDPDVASVRARLPFESYLGDDSVLVEFDKSTYSLAIGIGGTPYTRHRKQIFEQLRQQGFAMPALVHPSAIVSPSVRIASGVQVMAGACVQAGAQLGVGSLINTRASVDHECEVGEFVHVAPGSTICGRVRIGSGVFVGAGSTVIQNVSIGADSLIAAGSLVLHDLPERSRFSGAGHRKLQVIPTT